MLCVFECNDPLSKTSVVFVFEFSDQFEKQTSQSCFFGIYII